MFLHYLGKNESSNFHVFNNTGFISTKLVCSQAYFNISAEINQKKMLKIHVAVWHHTYF